MGKYFIIISTVLLLLVIGERNARNNKRIIYCTKKYLIEINGIYISLFRDGSLVKRIINSMLIIGTEILVTISVSTSVLKYVEAHRVLAIDMLIKILIIIMSLILIHYCMGYILLIIIKIQKFIYGVENKNVKVDLLLSYFIISTYFTVLIISPEQFKEASMFGLIGVTLCYILNIKVLIKLIINPHNIKMKNQDVASYSRVIVAAILIIGLIVLNLFLGVCFINSTDINAFSNSPSYFELLYYTIITFTTIGYGDITPISVSAKIISLIISITSVVCITIFLSTILSYKDKINRESE